MDGYLVQQPFADMIAAGRKVWDVRVRAIGLPRRTFYILSTRQPHEIASEYPEDRLAKIVATVRGAGVVGPLDVEEMIRHQDKHLIEPAVLRKYSRGRPLFAMVLADARPVDPPITYRPKHGAVHLILNVEETY